jgi:hypothetical protein
MNERIKELAEEASNGSDYDLECVTDAFLQIFAEAIVQECLDIVRSRSQWETLNQIKERFGIEL